jgi:hypothetical protein
MAPQIDIAELLNPSNSFGGLNPLSNSIGGNSGGGDTLSAIQALDGLGGGSEFGNPLSSLTGAGNTAGGGAGGFNFDTLFGGKDQAGALGLGFDFLSGIAEFKLLNDQLSLQEDQFDFQKGFANRNLQNQAKSVNTQLEDRQNARLQSTGDSSVGGTNYEALDTFLDKNALSEKKIR